MLEALGKLGVVADVVKAVREAAAPGGDKQVLLWGARALYHLVKYVPYLSGKAASLNAAAGAAVGGVEALALAVRDAPDQKALQYSLRAMSALIYNHPASVEAAGAAGAVEAVVAALRAHPDTQLTQEYACKALWRLMYGNSRDYGGLPRNPMYNPPSVPNAANVTQAKSAGARALVEAIVEARGTTDDHLHDLVAHVTNLSLPWLRNLLKIL